MTVSAFNLFIYLFILLYLFYFIFANLIGTPASL